MRSLYQHRPYVEPKPPRISEGPRLTVHAVNDYVKNILNFNRTESSWTLDPRGDYGQVYDQAKMIPSGVGNAVSVEFNLIYRWHACISERDVKWTEDFMRDSVKISDPATISVEELQKKLKAWGHSIPKDPAERTFGGFKRQPNGMFADKDLIDELAKSTEDIAGSFGPKNIPSVMRAIEIMGITQARKWKVATLNEFRQFCQLKPHETFEDINPDPEIAQTLRNMYDHPNLVEMYPGLMVEDAKKPMAPGSGLCPGFTISKAILADAVSLARGDRFCTTDYSPSNLTAWGYTEVSSDPEIVQGRVLYKLFHNAFPGWYRPNSVYAMYPFTIPSETKIILEGFGTAQNYNFDHPSFVAAPTPILTYNAVKDILADNKRFTPAWGPHIRTMTGQDYMLSGDSPANRQQREEIGKCLYSPPNGVAEIGKFYETVTLKLLKQKSYSTGKGYRVDFVRE